MKTEQFVLVYASGARRYLDGARITAKADRYSVLTWKDLKFQLVKLEAGQPDTYRVDHRTDVNGKRVVYRGARLFHYQFE